MTSRQPTLTKIFGCIVLTVLAVFAQVTATMAQNVAVLDRQPVVVTVVTVDHLDLNILQTIDLPNLKLLRNHGALGLISPGLARFPDPEGNQWASFTAGDVINTQNDHSGLLQRQLLANGVSDVVRIIRFGDAGDPAERLNLDDLIGSLLAGQSGRGGRVILCCITPPQSPSGKWDELCPIVIYPASPGETITSSTTRTVGLVALRDIAPTVLTEAGAPIPSSMSGSPISTVLYKGSRKTLLSRMVTVTRFGQDAIVPLSWFLGIAALLSITGGGWIVSGKRTDSDRIVCYLLRLIIAAPLTMLLVPCLHVSSVTTYMAAIVGVDLLIALVNSPTLLITATSVVLLADCVTGSHLIAATVISGFWLSGIRFYGIGNEYMGVLIGMGLLAPVLIIQNRSLKITKGISSIIVALFYLVVIFVLSYPAFGAKAGGTVTSVVTFGLAWVAIYTNKRPTWISFLGAAVIGFAAVFLMSTIAEHFHAPQSHIQSAVTAVHEGRLGYIKHVAIRKAKMAIKTVLTPGGMVAIACLIPLWLIGQRSKLRARVDDYLVSRPELAGALAAGCWGLLATILFNDSGGVAFLFFFGAMALVILHEMVRHECVSSRLTSAMFA